MLNAAMRTLGFEDQETNSALLWTLRSHTLHKLQSTDTTRDMSTIYCVINYSKEELKKRNTVKLLVSHFS